MLRPARTSAGTLDSGMAERDDLARELPDWCPLSPDEARGIERELFRELAPTHVLRGTSATALARGPDHPDDVLFRLEAAPARYAVVHLTWSVEARPEFPFTRLYPTLVDIADDAS